MPKTLKEYFPEKDYTARLAIGLVFLYISQRLTEYEGAVYMVLKWVFFIAALVNYVLILLSYQQQKKEKIRAREEAALKPPETPEQK
jgi:hypothetical protein